jgi:hypothetical protein
LLRFARNDGKIQIRDLAARCARVLLYRPALFIQRAQGMPGARSARSLACKSRKHASKSPRSRRVTRHSPRNGFNGCFALSPVTGLSCHRRKWSYLHQLDASVGASGPHDFAVRKPAPSSLALPASTASQPYVRDDRETPLCVGRDGERYAGDLRRKGTEIFLQGGLDR